MRIAITGMGVCSPIGKSLHEMLENIKNCRSAVREIEQFSTEGLAIKHAAEVPDYIPSTYFDARELSKLDRTAQFGILAARDAVTDAGLSDAMRQDERLGLVIGICAGGQGDPPSTRENAFAIDVKKFPETAIHKQMDDIAQALELRGPRAVLSTACASSGSALGYAYDMLRTGRADRVLVGGADALSISTYAGFYALGAMAAQPMSPFSEDIGVSFGEGAGFVVLEHLETARARSAKIYGEMLGYGATGDAHHVTSPHPAGEGLERAMRQCLSRAMCEPADIDYINAHGTGTRDNDSSESNAIRQLFKGQAAPPVSSTKSYFGHTLGAAGILEFIASTLAMNEGLIPPTINFKSSRPGCDLDYVPNVVRPGRIRNFLSNSAAFGGVNCSVAAGVVDDTRAVRSSATDDVWITGLGVVSPIGCGNDAFYQSLKESRCGLRPIDRFEIAPGIQSVAGLVDGFNPRKLAPTLDIRRAELITRYAMVAAGLAVQHGKLDLRSLNPERLGLAMGLTYGSISVQHEFQKSLEKDGLEKMSAKYFPSMVVSTIGGQVSQAFGLKGTVHTVVDGITGGLTTLAHGYDLMRADTAHDAMVIVAADELNSVYQEVYSERGWIARDSEYQAGAWSPYRKSQGMMLGEGAVALVLERAESARRRGAQPLACISGIGWTSDGPRDSDRNGQRARAIESALTRSGVGASEIDWIVGCGHGCPEQDQRDLDSLARVFSQGVPPLSCVSSLIGVGASSIGLFSVACALLGMQADEVLCDIDRDQAYVRTLNSAMVIGSTESGNNRAVVLTKGAS